MLTGMAGQKPCRPQLVRMAQVLGLSASQRHQPGLGLGGDRGLFARAGTIVQRRDWTVGQSSLNTPLDRLMMQPQGLGDRKERRNFSVGQKHPSPLNSACRFSSRTRDRRQRGPILIADRQLNHPPPCGHDFRPPFHESRARVQANGIRVNPTQMTSFMESMN